MIIEEVLEYQREKTGTIKIQEIEDFIKSKGINPVRYSIIEINNNIIKIGVSGIRNTDL